MAVITNEPRSKNFYVRFRFGARSYKRSLKCRNRREALAALGRIEETIRLLERGSIQMPPDADPAAFDSHPEAPEIHTLNEMISAYQASLPQGVKEASTLKTEGIHIDHVGKEQF